MSHKSSFIIIDALLQFEKDAVLGNRLSRMPVVFVADLALSKALLFNENQSRLPL